MCEDLFKKCEFWFFFKRQNIYVYWDFFYDAQPWWSVRGKKNKLLLSDPEKKIALVSLNFWIEFIFRLGFLIPFKTPHINLRLRLFFLCIRLKHKLREESVLLMPISFKAARVVRRSMTLWMHFAFRLVWNPQGLVLDKKWGCKCTTMAKLSKLTRSYTVYGLMRKKNFILLHNCLIYYLHETVS